MRKSTKQIRRYIKDFLIWLEIEKGLSITSREGYTRFIEKFMDWLNKNNLGKISPHQLSLNHIWQYRLYLSGSKKKPLKKSTINYHLMIVRSLLDYFADKEIVAISSNKIKLAKDSEERKIHFLDLDQVMKLLSAPDISNRSGLRDRAILETLFSTGTRISELANLDRNQIKITADELELSILGKGRRVRTIYFSKRALFWIKKYLSRRHDHSPALFINYKKALLTSPSRRLTTRYIEQLTKKYAIEVGLPATTTPHTLRHSFSTYLLNQGVDLRTLQEFLGHKSIATTQIYTHVTNRHLQETHSKYYGEMPRE